MGSGFWRWALLGAALAGCSRSGLLLDAPADTGAVGSSPEVGTSGAPSGVAGGAPNSSGAAGVLGGTSAGGAKSLEPPEHSGRYIAVETRDKASSQQLFALELGVTSVASVTRLDDATEAHDVQVAAFSPLGQSKDFAFVTLSATDQHESVSLVDLRGASPQVSSVFSGLPNALRYNVGPWLDDSRVFLPGPADSSGAALWYLVDRNAPERAQPIALTVSGERVQGLSAAPGARVLVAHTIDAAQVERLYAVDFDDPVSGPWTLLEALPAGVVYEYDVFSSDGTHLATLAVDDQPGAPHPLYSLHAFDLGADPPASVLALPLPSGDIGDFVSFAPSGQRLVLNLTRLVDGRGYSIASVHDLATGASGEAEPARFASFTVGFSGQGKGLLYNDFQDELGTHGTSFMDVSDPAHPGDATFLFDAEGKPTRAGLLNPDGSSFFAFTGNLDDLGAASQHGPVDCTRFDFGSGLSAPVHVARLANVANVLNWLPSPDVGQLVFSTGIPGGVIEDQDPLDYRSAVAELGIYSLDLSASAAESAPVRLPTRWTAYDRFAWLPDSSGILREAPATDPSVVADTTANGQSAGFVLPDTALVLEWILLGSQLGKAVSLAGLYGEQHYMTSDDRVIVPEHW